MAPHAVGVIGLGRMGRQIARRLHRKGFRVIAWNRSAGPGVKLSRFFALPPSPPSSPPRSGERKKRRGSGSLVFQKIPDLISAMTRPRIIWLMLPSGETTGQFIKELTPSLSKRDIIIDGGNSFYQDSIRRAKKLARRKIHFLDCGTSGGVWGEKNGFSLMVGGDKKVFKKVEPIFQALAAPPSPGERRVVRPQADREGLHYGWVGPSGAGHFVKMVHNGIEYGMMEAIAEGFAVLNKWNPKIDLAEVARIWEKGSVVSSWLISLARDIFEKEDLRKIAGYIHHTGEGEWAIKTAKRLKVDVRVIENAFKVRLESSQKKNQNKFSNKIVSLLRNRFGGHEVTRK